MKNLNLIKWSLNKVVSPIKTIKGNNKSSSNREYNQAAMNNTISKQFKAPILSNMIINNDRDKGI